MILILIRPVECCWCWWWRHQCTLDLGILDAYDDEAREDEYGAEDDLGFRRVSEEEVADDGERHGQTRYNAVPRIRHIQLEVSSSNAGIYPGQWREE